MKKLLLTTALAGVLGVPAWAADVPYAMQRSGAPDVAAIAPAAGEETPAPASAPAGAEAAAKEAAPAVTTPDGAPVELQKSVPEPAAAPAASPKPPAENAPAVQLAAPADKAVADTAPAAGVAPPASPSGTWDYSSAAGGPANWGTLDAAYSACASGQKQSPINISMFFQEDMPDFVAAYTPVPLALVNDGSTLRAEAASGGGFSVDGLKYTLQSIAFRTPSEHYMDGAPYPMEAQFLHKAEDGSLAMVGVMIKAGAHNKIIEALWQNAPANAGGEKKVEDVKFSASDLMPKAATYYRYSGSLTTPPCTEGVQWFILKDPIEASVEQVKAFQKMFPLNARPVQPIGQRVVTGE